MTNAALLGRMAAKAGASLTPTHNARTAFDDAAERAPKPDTISYNAAMDDLPKNAGGLIKAILAPRAARSKLSNYLRTHCGWFRSCSPKSRNSLRRRICPASVASSTATATVA